MEKLDKQINDSLEEMERKNQDIDPNDDDFSTELPADFDESIEDVPLLEVDEFDENPELSELEEISQEELENALIVDNIAINDPVKMYLKESVVFRFCQSKKKLSLQRKSLMVTHMLVNV